ncbi:MAG: hydrogenase maturation nickel metallochaperone HypA [bacterium]
MHELGIAHSILDIVLQKARDHNAEKIVSVDLAFGEKIGIVKESMEFIWDVITQHTIAQGSRLNIRIIEVEAECQKCGNRFVVCSMYEPCPYCKSDEIAIVQGLNEMQVVSLDIDEGGK